MGDITAKDKAECAEREVRQRQKVYYPPLGGRR